MPHKQDDLKPVPFNTIPLQSSIKRTKLSYVRGNYESVDYMEAPGIVQEWAVHENVHYLTPDTDASNWTFPDQDIGRIIADTFKEVRQVKSICARYRTDEIAIWTLLDSYDRNAREEVYKRELAVCDELRLRDFEFRVSSIDLVSPYELINTGSLEIYRRD